MSIDSIIYAELSYPLDLNFQSVQPIFVLDNRFLILSSDQPPVAMLETAAGGRHGLVEWGAIDTLCRAARDAVIPAAERLLAEALPRSLAALGTDPLAYVVDYLAGAFAKRDWSDQAYDPKPLAAQLASVDWSVAVRRIAREIPVPKIEPPVMLLLGRAWKLDGHPYQPGCFQVFDSGRWIRLSGDYYLLGRLAADWQTRVREFISLAAEQLLAEAGKLGATSSVSEARRELERTGFVERGELVFLEGQPPRLGHIVPRHYNRTLQRDVNRDLAVTSPLIMPPTAYPSRSALCVYERVGGKWRPAHLPHGLCLGDEAPRHAQDSPGIGLAAYLRWGAERIAENGAFHSSDDSHNSDYDYGQ